MKRKIGLMALALALTATLAACGKTAENYDPDPSAPAVAPTASPNTVTKGLEETARGVGDTVQGAVNDMGRMTQYAGSEMRHF